MRKPYEIQRTSSGITVWIKNGIQSFTDEETIGIVNNLLDTIRGSFFKYYYIGRPLLYKSDPKVRDSEPIGSDW